MTKEQTSAIREMRINGQGYKAIAAGLGIPLGTVQSYCRRNDLDGKAQDLVAAGVCRYCGKPLQQMKGKRRREFCSDRCRIRWWDAHRDQINSHTTRKVTCACCGREFDAYVSSGRKYCSHACYIRKRFGGAV